MKRGTRALGLADSYAPDAEESTVAGAVVRGDRVFDGLTFGRITVGGTNSTERLTELVRRVDRPDAQYVLISGIAPAWYNIVDLPLFSDAINRPVVSVSFEASEGLESALRDAFDGDALSERLARYERQPPRRAIDVNGEQLFVRSVGLDTDETRRVIRAFTPEGGRPEPIRVAHTTARAGDALLRSTGPENATL